MRNITSIGIENFRVFDKMTTFDLAPITLLTGANNTGKSSLLKILKLLQENQKVLDWSCFTLEKFCFASY